MVTIDMLVGQCGLSEMAGKFSVFEGGEEDGAALGLRPCEGL